MDERVREARDAWAAQDWQRSATLYEQLAVQAPDDPRAGSITGTWTDLHIAT
jgi:hypothetical protein